MTRKVSQMAWLCEKAPWFRVPMLSFKISGFTRCWEVQYNQDYLRKLDTPEKTYQFIQTVRKEDKLDNYLVFKKCPKCGWELPALDFNVDGNCVFCGEHEAAEKAEKSLGGGC